MASFLRSRAASLAAIALLAALAYAPALSLPLIEDDYPNLAQVQAMGYVGSLANPVFRLRATSSWIMLALWHSVHLTPVVYHVTSLALHIANCWLVYLICLAIPKLRAAAFWAAAFFAVQEGHQEAVMWFSAINELLQFLFGAAALLCLLRALRQTRRWPLDLAALGFFACALLSKESAVIWIPLFALAVARPPWRAVALRLLPFALLASIAIFSLAATHNNFRFSDGSFSLHAPFWLTLPHGVFRVLWIWGFVSIAIFVFRLRPWRAALEPAAAALVWIAIALIPYSFLTYSTEIPSRQTYLASAGLAALVGLTFAQIWNGGGPSRQIAIAVAVLMAVHNIGYLWIKKRAQFAARAEPTQALIRLARQTHGPIYVKCFPRPLLIAQQALEIAAGLDPSDIELTPDEAAARPPAATFCLPK